MKKAVALLIVILLIAIFGSVAVTMTRAGLLNSIFTTNAIDAMSAQEASQSGLEVGLLHYKIWGTSQNPEEKMCINLDIFDANPPRGQFCSGISAKIESADLSIKLLANNFIQITSTGHYGYTVKKHFLKQKVEAWQ